MARFDNEEDNKLIIQNNCPGGCPCDSFECEDVTPTVTSTTSVPTTTSEPAAKNAVLMLSTYESSNIPMVLGYNGKPYCQYDIEFYFLIQPYHLGDVEDDISFTFDDYTEVYYSCAATLNDEMWILGGANYKRQVIFC